MHTEQHSVDFEAVSLLIGHVDSDVCKCNTN